MLSQTDGYPSVSLLRSIESRTNTRATPSRSKVAFMLDAKSVPKSVPTVKEFHEALNSSSHFPIDPLLCGYLNYLLMIKRCRSGCRSRRRDFDRERVGIVAGTGTVAKLLQGAWTFGESGMDLEEDMDVGESKNTLR